MPQVGKLFISQQHTLTVRAGSQSPGPAANYHLPASIGGKQPDGRKSDPPLWSFGGSVRNTLTGDGKGLFTPGAIYQTQASIGPQPEGKVPNSPRCGFGASTRDVRAKVFISQEHNEGAAPFVPTPGPAANYAIPQAVGPQVSTTPSREAARGLGICYPYLPVWTLHTPVHHSYCRPALS